MKVYDGRNDASAEPDQQRLKVGIAEYEVTTDGTVLTTSGLGSCIAVAIHDESAPVAGLAHVMLPTAEDTTGEDPAKFADTGVEALIDALVDAGADPANMVAKIVGGSDMIEFAGDGSGIGQRNLDQVRETLAPYDIPVVGEDIGGTRGRSVRLEGATGDLVVTSGDSEPRTL